MNYGNNSDDRYRSREYHHGGRGSYRGGGRGGGRGRFGGRWDHQSDHRRRNESSSGGNDRQTSAVPLAELVEKVAQKYKASKREEENAVATNNTDATTKKGRRHIALLFLTIDDLPQEHVWKATRQVFSHNHLTPHLPDLADKFEDHLTSNTFQSSLLDRHDFNNICMMFN